ncbi:MAG: tetratricopeptide repeat protein [Okeania sp. SIO2C9]|nr:tetratricopeptide repeat protein [Okeania sp. SIO2C9]NEQ74843.1 tetratricopeptide repeat protein [Okeania sp. SIO2C9]
MTINTKYFLEANQLKRQGKLEQAIALYYQAIELNPNFSWSGLTQRYYI